MNTDLMTKLQTLIYSNQDRLQQLVEALESVCSKSNTTVATEPKVAPKHPLDDYTISEKDVGSLFLVDDEYLDLLSGVGDRFVGMRDCGSHYSWEIKPYTNTIKLHFRPFHATEDSKMPSELKHGTWVAVLLDNGVIDISEDASAFIWRSGCECVIIGYQILSFVNPVLDK